MADNYQLVKKTLRLDAAVRWLAEDSKDDFFPDPLNFADVVASSDNYLSRREHRILQLDVLPHVTEFVPKRNGMLREAVWLHPTHRILYLGGLHHFLPRLDSMLTGGVYSYRRDSGDDPDAYPFENKMERWKHCSNDFREAALDPSTRAVLVTDIASFFDHISCDELCNRIRSLLGSTVTAEDEAVLEFLGRMLRMWSTSGFGIPQNLDASSFLGSLYLHPVDHEMAIKRYRYFRWVDDIKIVATSKRQAVRALHDLQSALARHRLFLSGEKTTILERGDGRFESLLDVEDDKLISEAEEIIRSGDCLKMKALLPSLFERLNHHASPNGDERKFRAYANRILDIGDFRELRAEVHPGIRRLVLPRLSSHPDRTDYWTKLLAGEPDADTLAAATAHLVGEPSVFDWQRFYLWRFLTHCAGPLPEPVMERALETCGSSISELEAAQAIVCVGKHGDNAARELLFARHFKNQRSYVVQRAVLIAIQELPEKQRSGLYRRALQINLDHHELVEFLEKQKTPIYGPRRRLEKDGRAQPLAIEAKVLRGVGLVHGVISRFRLVARDYDYE